ncbi:MAG: helix-turn-helix transcriptional regulator [Pseudomonadales bacterium]
MRTTEPKTHQEMVAETLRAARIAAGLSLRELAERAGTSHATLSAYEQGKKVPSATNYLRILEACGNAVDIRIEPRIRERDGIPRGEELEAVLELAEQFPHRMSRHLDLPRFPADASGASMG